MSDVVAPKNWKDAIPSVAWGAVVFTCFFVTVEKVIEQNYGQALFALIVGLAVMGIALHSRTWLERTNPTLAFAGALMALLTLVTSPMIERGWGPFRASSIIHDPPSDEDIAKSAAPLIAAARQAEAAAKAQAEAAIHDRDAARQERDAARRAIAPPQDQDTATSQPARSTRTVEALSLSERDSLSRELYKLKSIIPEIYLTESLVGPPSHYRSIFVSIFSKAGIRSGTTFQALEGPDQTGLLLCVPDVNLIPEKVKKLAQVLLDFGIETNYAPLVPSRISSVVPPEIGFVLFVAPKSP